MKWEYRSETNIADLNELGKEGWELCAVIPIIDTTKIVYHYLFKRQLPENPKDRLCICPDCGAEVEVLEREKGYSLKFLEHAK
jgi:hypothetical protein